MQAKVAVFGTVRFPPERMADIRPHLKTLVETTRRDDGCIAYDVAEDLLEPGLLRFSELWPDHESLAGHIKAPHIPPWHAASRECGVVERKYTIYDISFARGA